MLHKRTTSVTSPFIPVTYPRLTLTVADTCVLLFINKNNFIVDKVVLPTFTLLNCKGDLFDVKVDRLSFCPFVPNKRT